MKIWSEYRSPKTIMSKYMCILAGSVNLDKADLCPLFLSFTLLEFERKSLDLFWKWVCLLDLNKGKEKRWPQITECMGMIYS